MKTIKKHIKAYMAVLLAVIEIALIGITSLIPLQALEAPDVTNISGAYLYNFENDKLIFESNADEVIYPTSSVKLMTAIIAIESLADKLDEKITITASMLESASGNNIGLKTGETVTVKDMLYALIVNGANDAAYVLAYKVAGGPEAFVKQMNERASSLGAYQTTYTNPTGMHNSKMVTTISDTAIIAKHAYSIELFMEIASTSKYIMEKTNKSGTRNIYNRNCLISMYYDSSYYYEKASGMNAGSTAEGGHCVITTATDGELSYLSIVMGGQTVDNVMYSYKSTINLLDWAFNSYANLPVLSTSKMICEMPVILSSAVDYVTLVPENDLIVYLPVDIDIEKEIEFTWNTYDDELSAPVTAGQVVGTITAIYKGDILGSSNLVVTSDVARSELLYALFRIEKFTKSRFFIATLVTAIILSIVYVFGNAYLRQKRKVKRGRFT